MHIPRHSLSCIKGYRLKEQGTNSDGIQIKNIYCVTETVNLFIYIKHYQRENNEKFRTYGYNH